MRGRKQDTELKELEAGLGQAEDPYMIKELVQRPVEENVAEVNKEVRYSAFSMLRAGRLYMAMKKQVGFGKWESFVDEQRWSWDYVRASMKFLEVVARFPQALHLPSGRAIDRILRLPAPKIDEVFLDLSPEAIKKLTPWDLEQIYDAKKRERRKPAKQVDPRDPDRTEFDDAYDNAVVALGELAAVKLTQRDRDNVHKLDLAYKLAQIYETASKHIHPVEEIVKRAEIVGRKGN